MGGGGCFSQTLYTRMSDGANMGFCVQGDGSVDVMCPDGSTRETTTERGTWNGSFTNGRHSGTAEVSFGTVDPATGALGNSYTATRKLTMTLGG